MTDLIAFIEARLAEDEAAASAIDVPDWRAESSWMSELIDPLPSQRRQYDGQFPLITAEDVRHIARHDPARVLREVEAKRRIVERYKHRIESFRQHPNHGNGSALGALEETIRDVAGAWSEHSDYRAEWRPE